MCVMGYQILQRNMGRFRERCQVVRSFKKTKQTDYQKCLIL